MLHAWQPCAVALVGGTALCEGIGDESRLFPVAVIQCCLSTVSNIDDCCFSGVDRRSSAEGANQQAVEERRLLYALKVGDLTLGIQSNVFESYVSHHPNIAAHDPACSVAVCSFDWKRIGILWFSGPSLEIMQCNCLPGGRRHGLPFDAHG